MTYRVRCKRRQRMPPWAMNVDLDAMAQQVERHGHYSDLELPLPRSFPKRRAWPAISRRDAEKMMCLDHPVYVQAAKEAASAYRQHCILIGRKWSSR